MASLAEQLRSLSNPEPSRFDLDEDEFDITRAQTIHKEAEDGDIDGQTFSTTSDLRKKTTPLLHDVDKKYAGHRISRAQLEASRSHVASSDDEEEGELESGSEDNLNGFGISNDEDMLGDDNDDVDDDNDDGSDDVDESDDQDEEVTIRKNKHGITDNDEDDDHDDGSDDHDDDDDISADESDIVHLKSDSKSGEDYSSASEDDLDISGSEDQDDDEEEDVGDDAIQSFSATNLKEDVEKGKAAKNQLSLWDSFLEMRIRLQKALLIANRLPQQDQLASFNSSGDKNLKETYKQGRKTVAKLLGNILWIQEKLLEQNPDTKSILHPETESSKSTAHGSDEEEEIPSDTEDEKSDDGDDDDAEDEEDRTNGEQAQSSLKLPAKRKHELATSEYAGYISKRHAAFKSYRDATISKWSEKTRLASGKLNSKSFSSFDRSALAQINHILSDKARLVKRTQLKRTPYRVLGKSEDDEQQSKESKEEQSDLHLKDYDSEIFDDDDFYHQLLREFIEQRTSGNTGNSIDMGRQWLELQKLRRKVKRKVDTKASKGRKIRYDIHGKLVSFMAPIEKGTMVDSSRNELFCSLFGAKQQEQAADINVFR